MTSMSVHWMIAFLKAVCISRRSLHGGMTSQNTEHRAVVNACTTCNDCRTPVCVDSIEEFLSARFAFSVAQNRVCRSTIWSRKAVKFPSKIAQRLWILLKTLLSTHFDVFMSRKIVFRLTERSAWSVAVEMVEVNAKLSQTNGNWQF